MTEQPALGNNFDKVQTDRQAGFSCPAKAEFSTHDLALDISLVISVYVIQRDVVFIRFSITTTLRRELRKTRCPLQHLNSLNVE